MSAELEALDRIAAALELISAASMFQPTAAPARPAENHAAALRKHDAVVYKRLLLVLHTRFAGRGGILASEIVKASISDAELSAALGEYGSNVNRLGFLL